MARRQQCTGSGPRRVAKVCSSHMPPEGNCTDQLRRMCKSIAGPYLPYSNKDAHYYRLWTELLQHSYSRPHGFGYKGARTTCHDTCRHASTCSACTPISNRSSMLAIYIPSCFACGKTFAALWTAALSARGCTCVLACLAPTLCHLLDNVSTPTFGDRRSC